MAEALDSYHILAADKIQQHQQVVAEGSTRTWALNSVAVASSKLCLNLAMMVAVGSLRQPLAEADKWRQGVVVEE